MMVTQKKQWENVKENFFGNIAKFWKKFGATASKCLENVGTFWKIFRKINYFQKTLDILRKLWRNL